MAADQLELFSLPNPCIGVCESNRKGFCKGCLRSREERYNWHQKSLQEQRSILTKLSQRRARLLRQLHDTESNASANLSAPGQIDLFAAPPDNDPD